MRQRRDGARLPFEADESLRIAGEPIRQHLDGDVTPEADVAGTIDLSHATGPDQFDDLDTVPGESPRQAT